MSNDLRAALDELMVELDVQFDDPVAWATAREALMYAAFADTLTCHWKLMHELGLLVERCQADPASHPLSKNLCRLSRCLIEIAQWTNCPCLTTRSISDCTARQTFLVVERAVPTMLSRD